MTISITLIAVLACALMYLGFGIALLLFPVILLKNAGIFLNDPVGIMEARSFYGGLEIGLGLFLLYSYFKVDPKYAVLLSLFLLFFTLVGRFYGLVADAAWSRYFIYAISLEGTVFLLNVISYFKLTSTH